MRYILRFFRRVRSDILSLKIFKGKNIPERSIYLMPYRDGAIYVLNEKEGMYLFRTNCYRQSCFKMFMETDLVEGAIITADLLDNANKKSFVSLVLLYLLTSVTQPSTIYAFIETEGIIADEKCYNFLKHSEKKILFDAIAKFEGAADKLGLLDELKKLNYHNLFYKNEEREHIVLSGYFEAWIRENEESLLEEKAESIAGPLQRNLVESNSYNEYIDNCVKANVPHDCILCLPAVSKSFALALLKAGRLLKQYKNRPKNSDLISVLHTTERGLVGLKVSFSEIVGKNDHNITVGTAFINHDNISGTQNVNL